MLDTGTDWEPNRHRAAGSDWALAMWVVVVVVYFLFFYLEGGPTM